MSDVFISYVREEKSQAEQLVRALVPYGLSCWWDSQITAGDTWAEMIERELSIASCVLVLWSENSVRSRWVCEEARYAIELKKLIPVKIEDVTVPLGFSFLQTLELMDWTGESSHPGFKELVVVINHHLVK